MKFCRIFVLLSVLSASSSAVFRPPEDPVKNSEQPGVPWHPDWAEVVGCKRGETHSRFPACWCGQYGKIVKDTEVHSIPLEELESEGYHYKLRGNRKIFYVCLPCSSCPDGILTTRKCRQGQDTSCDLDQCVNQDHVFDQGKKACVSNSKEIPELVEHTEDPLIDLGQPTAGHSEDGLTPLVANADGLAVEDPSKAKAWHQHVVIITLVVSLIVAIGHIIVIIHVLRHRKRRRYRTLTRVPSNLSQATTQTGCTCMLETPV